MDLKLELKKAKRKEWRRKIAIALGGWLIMAPGLFLFAFFVWYPLGANIVMSFFKPDGLWGYDNFVGFQNFIDVFKDEQFIQALQNTGMYVLLSLVIGFILPLIIGLLLSEVVHGKAILRILIYFPAILSGMAVVIMWSYILDPNQHSMLNQILGLFGISPSTFTHDPNLAKVLIILTMTWKGAGSTALIYLSAIQNIDQAQYEAARLDGAGLGRRIWHITLPNIAPTLSTLFVLQIISVMQIFYEPMVMPGTNNSTLSLLLLAYNYNFVRYEPGKSAATSVILFILIMSLTLLYFGVERIFKGSFNRTAKGKN